jgi:DNA-binding NtrC family response regulator
MFHRESKVMQRLGAGFLQNLKIHHKERRPSAPPSWKEGESREGFAAELFDLISRHFCLDNSFCLKGVMEELEKEIISHVLSKTHWNQKKAAKILGIKHTTLNYRVRKLGLLPGRGGATGPQPQDLLDAERANGKKPEVRTA